MINCQGCGAINEPDALNCAACGRVLAVICPQCSTANSSASSFCNHCGRILSSDTQRPDPVAEMFRTGEKQDSHSSPQEPFLKLTIGGFVFALLHLSQILAGSPIANALAGLISGLVALWGLIGLLLWLLDAFDSQPEEEATVKVLQESFPAGVESGFSGTDASFEELDQETQTASSKAHPDQKALGNLNKKRKDKKIQADTMVASMVSGGVIRSHETSPAKQAEDHPDASKAATDKTGEARDPYDSDELTLESEELDTQPRDITGITLAEFLEDGVMREIASVKRKIKRSPDNFSLPMRLAQLHEERGELSNAVDAMSRCVAFSPQVAEVYLYYGTLLRRANEFEHARDAFNKALSLNRFLSKAYYQIGAMDRTTRNLTGARDALQKCIQLSPDDPYAHYQLGMVYRELGNLPLALMELKRATILHPSDSYGHSRLGQIYQQTKQYDHAVTEYSYALSLKPGDPFVLEKLAQVMTVKGSLERARELYQEAISCQFHPEITTMTAFANLLQQMGETSDLQSIVDEILRLEPANPKALFLQGLIHRDQKKYDEALDVFEKLGDAHPEVWEAWLETGKIHQLKGNNEKALSAFIRASPNATDQAGIWNSIGILLSNQKKYEEAIVALRKAAGFDYSDPQIQANLKAVQKKIDTACKKTIESCSRLLQEVPDNIDTYLELGRAYELQNMYEDALMVYQKVLSIKPDSIDGLLHYAEILRQKGRLKLAVRCYREILKLQQDHLPTRLKMIQANLSMGMLNEALRHAVVAQKVSPDDPGIHFLLGKIYFAKGLAPRALKEFTIVANTAVQPDMISWAELMRRRLTVSK